ncbi:MAG: hypothetical protein HPY53_05930 [Brevinematales bacterium]|nr:hypothetical protein [Brevinematales bacterium]
MNWKTISGTLAKYVNLDELVFDITLALFAIFFRALIIPAGKTVVDILNPTTAVMLTLLIDFFVTFFLGNLFLRYEPLFEKHPGVKNLLYVVISLTILFLYIGIPANMYNFGLIKPDNMMIPFLAGLFLIIGAAFMGFDKDRGTGCGVTLAILSIPVLFGLIYVMLYIGEEMKNWFLGSVVLIVGLIAYGVGIWLVGRLKKTLLEEGSKVMGIVRIVVFGVMFPLTVALMLGFWQEISIIAMVKNGGTFGFNMIFNLVLYGIIPVRILMAAAPPYRIINTGVGIASLTVYFFTLQAYIESLIGAVK